jgi:hypothetical protein
VALERGTIPPVIGLWWTHAVVVVTVLLIARLPHWLARLRNRTSPLPPAFSPA